MIWNFIYRISFAASKDLVLSISSQMSLKNNKLIKAMRNQTALYQKSLLTNNSKDKYIHNMLEIIFKTSAKLIYRGNQKLSKFVYYTHKKKMGSTNKLMACIFVRSKLVCHGFT